jgi:hypothetical protein
MVDKWEYKIIRCEAKFSSATGLPPDVNERFDEWGTQGWELVGLQPIKRPWILPFSSKTVWVAFFKRPVRS